ncbi:hypothetical protein A0J61_05517 [Choanephora cucurbitarum]|uniref:Uncharacterized protein n=1 Tax=Choanephora cucurbitarum TaxID=101091 RepID=A0A1C7NBG4_9FUNG|nr:hypothetical protein A0J61_05517 [Choanephora cucurbitarum]
MPELRYAPDEKKALFNYKWKEGYTNSLVQNECELTLKKTIKPKPDPSYATREARSYYIIADVTRMAIIFSMEHIKEGKSPDTTVQVIPSSSQHAAIL